VSSVVSLRRKYLLLSSVPRHCYDARRGCYFGPDEIPDDILQAASRVGLEVTLTSDIDDSSLFYCLKFSGPLGRLVFQQNGYVAEDLFSQGKKSLNGYGTFICFLGRD
jgi:hypothetical protein